MPFTCLLSRAIQRSIRTYSRLLPRGRDSWCWLRMASTAAKKDFQRLPTDVIPVNYCLELTPDLQAFTFAGRLRIEVDVKKVTKQIKLNAADLEIGGAQFKKTLDDGKPMVAKVSLCADKEELTFDFETDLPGGKAYLEMEYKGVLNGDMKGFYRTRYTTNWGEERYAATTQFEPTDARRALPCWDEPVHKATFDVSLVVPHDRVALSNMNAIKDARINSNLRKVTFAQTPRMSTYLLAFIVGEFDYVEGRDSNGVLIRVYTPMAKSEQGQFALDVAKKTLPFYTDYFNVKYPLPKMDLIAIPDFAAGAMENWGLVTYRERLLLVDPKATSLQSKQLVALVVGHELAHQWFGNLVTMEWWTHLWLNEGFATFIEYLCVDHCLGPDYDIWTQFNSQTYSPALKGDALANSHPIEVPVGHPDEVEEIFDLISYSKGASVIRMLHDWVGDENFRKGMHEYLTKYAYSNTQTEDLWRCLGEASGQPVDKVMSSWTKQMGYPVLDVKRRQEGGDTVLTLSQKKFCADGDSSTSEGYMWQVPVNVRVQGKEGVETFLLEKKEMEYRLKGVGTSSWIKVNPEQKGFFRVHYSPDMLAALTQAIPSLPPSDRLGLLDEAFALAKAGVMRTDEALKLLDGYRSEHNYTVWENLAGHIADLNRLLSNTDFHCQFKKFAVGLFQNVVDHLGWEPREGEQPLDSMLRGLVLTAHGVGGNEDTLKKAKEKFTDHCEACDKQDSSPIPADLRGVVYQLAMRQGDMTTFDKIFELSEGTDHQEEKVRLYRALGQTEKEDVLSKCHEYSLSDKVRAADSWALLVSASMASRTGREKTWQFVKDNIGELKKRLGGAFLLSRVLELTTSNFANEEVAKEVEEFFKAGGPNHIPTAERALKQSCETIRNNAKWLARDRDAIKSFLDNPPK